MEGFNQGFFAVCKDGLWGYADRRGNLITPLIYFKKENFYD